MKSIALAFLSFCLFISGCASKPGSDSGAEERAPASATICREGGKLDSSYLRLLNEVVSEEMNRVACPQGSIYSIKEETLASKIRNAFGNVDLPAFDISIQNFKDKSIHDCTVSTRAFYQALVRQSQTYCARQH